MNTNTYTADQAAGLVRGMYAYHVNGNGWCDIGYQFLVDRFGRLYEGRFGGDYKNVVGAQAAGFNMQSFGISSIANHDPGTAGAVAPSATVLIGHRQADRLEGLAERLRPVDLGELHLGGKHEVGRGDGRHQATGLRAPGLQPDHLPR